jgi:transposase
VGCTIATHESNFRQAQRALRPDRRNRVGQKAGRLSAEPRRHVIGDGRDLRVGIGRAEGGHARQKDELARVDQQIRAIVEAIKDGLRTPAMKDGLTMST